MKKIITITIILVLSALLFSCNKNKHELKYEKRQIGKNLFIDEKALYDEIKDGVIDTPRKTLIKLYFLDKEKEYGEMKKYIYNIKYDNGTLKFNSQDKIIEGIINRVMVNNFSYNEIGILFHIYYIDKFIKYGDKESIRKSVITPGFDKQDQYLQKLIIDDPYSLAFYNLEFTIIGFIKHEGVFKLFYSMNMSDYGIDVNSYLKDQSDD